jgi:hypothetical protein
MGLLSASYSVSVVNGDLISRTETKIQSACTGNLLCFVFQFQFGGVS